MIAAVNMYRCFRPHRFVNARRTTLIASLCDSYADQRGRCNYIFMMLYVRGACAIMKPCSVASKMCSDR